MTETRIRWSDEPGETLGYVGTFGRPAFRIWPPDEEGDRILLVYLAGDGQHMYHDDTPHALEPLKTKAERLLSEFVSSLGAIFGDAVAADLRSRAEELGAERDKLLFAAGLKRAADLIEHGDEPAKETGQP